MHHSKRCRNADLLSPVARQVPARLRKRGDRHLVGGLLLNEHYAHPIRRCTPPTRRGSPLTRAQPSPISARASRIKGVNTDTRGLSLHDERQQPALREG